MKQMITNLNDGEGGLINQEKLHFGRYLTPPPHRTSHLSSVIAVRGLCLFVCALQHSIFVYYDIKAVYI